MRRLNLSRLSGLPAAIAIVCTTHAHAAGERIRTARDDEGSELVAMAILAGALAGLAYLLYLVLKAKAMGWVHKIPGPGTK